MSQNINYEWHIDDDLMKKFKIAKKCETFYSDNFGFNGFNDDPLMQYGFCMTFTPIGITAFWLYTTVLSFNLLCLPKNVRKIEYKYKLQCGKLIKDGDSSSRLIPRLEKIPIPLKIPKFTVNIVIEKVWDRDGNLVEQNKWNEYGIE